MKTIKIKLKDDKQGYRYVRVPYVVDQTIVDDCLVLEIKPPGLYSNSKTDRYPLINILMWSTESG